MLASSLDKMAALELALPVATAFAALATIITCYGLARSNGDLPEYLHIVQISLLGCRGPERAVFSAGFVLTALLLASSIVLYLDRALPRFEAWLRAELSAAAVLALVGAFGLGLLGAVPLQRDCIDCIMGVATLQQESIVHGYGALTFFSASWLHGIVAIHVYGRSPRHRRSRRLARVRALRIILVALPIVSIPFAWLGGRLLQGAPVMRMQVGALHQWLTISSMLGMYLSYVVDLLVFRGRGGSAGAEDLVDEDEASSSEDGDWLRSFSLPALDRLVKAHTEPILPVGGVHAEPLAGQRSGRLSPRQRRQAELLGDGPHE